MYTYKYRPIFNSHGVRGTCSNFLQSLTCQSSIGGDSGQKTKSASDANAATIAKYLKTQNKNQTLRFKYVTQ